MTIAIDFDNTIVEENYPGIGALKPGAKEYINRLFHDGHHLIIWTCRAGNPALQAEQFLIDNMILYHKFNEQMPAALLLYGTDTRKISADIYIDDRGILGIGPWDTMYEIVTLQQLKKDQLFNAIKID